MKITFILPKVGLAGGIRVAAIYADRLQKRGHQVMAISTPASKPGWKQQVSSVLKGKGWLAPQEQKRSHFDVLNVPHHVIDRSRPVIDTDVPDADVVIATWWETAEWVHQLSTRKGAKAYFIQHHEVFDYLPVERVKATYRLPLHKITISKWLEELMTGEYGDRHVSVIPNSVDTDLFYAPPRPKQAVPTVGMIYSITPWKGCTVSLAALETVAQAVPNLRVIMFGLDPLPADFSLPANVEFHYRPAQTQLRDLYGQCDVWLNGSWTEGFSLPPLEAMACRCPVVSTAVGGLDILLQPGSNGYLVPVGDSAALAERLIEVLNLSESQWQVMSQAAYQTATNYTWDDATDRFEAALHTAIERQSSPLPQPLLTKHGS